MAKATRRRRPASSTRASTKRRRRRVSKKPSGKVKVKIVYRDRRRPPRSLPSGRIPTDRVLLRRAGGSVRAKDLVMITRPMHVTFGQLNKLPKGSKLELFFMDRNLLDMIDQYFSTHRSEAKGIGVHAREVFRDHGYFVHYTKISPANSGSLKGTWKWTIDGMNQKGKPEEQHFDIEDPDRKKWVPMSMSPPNGMICDAKEKKCYRVKKGKGYPAHLRVGWRGPCVKAFDLYNRFPLIRK